jgi:hypothetical protein
LVAALFLQTSTTSTTLHLLLPNSFDEWDAHFFCAAAFLCAEAVSKKHRNASVVAKK